jgi:hypothetical protein
MGHCRTSGGISKGGETIWKFEHKTVIYRTAKLFHISIRHSKDTNFIQKQVMRNTLALRANSGGNKALIMYHISNGKLGIWNLAGILYMVWNTVIYSTVK